MKKLIQLFLLFGFIGYSQSIERQVIGSAGTTVTDGSSVVLEYTVGELAVDAFTDGNTQVSQGFHQGTLNVLLNIGAVVYLQGAYLSPNSGEESLMRDDLRVAGVIPTTSPYADAATCQSSVFTTTGADAIVDWVWVELRDESDAQVILASQSALLQRDGDIVAEDGVSPVNFALSLGNYFISVNHRNHLGIMSANPLALSTSVTAVNFTNNEATIAGGSNAVTDVNGKLAIYGGDYNGDGQVLNTDVQLIIPKTGLGGYRNSDLDLNGQVLNSDIQNIVIKNSGKGEQF